MGVPGVQNAMFDPLDYDSLPVQIAYFFTNDIIAITVEDAPNLSRCEMIVGLELGELVKYQKEILGWSADMETAMSSVVAVNSNTGPNYMLLSRPRDGLIGSDTVVFKSAKFFGVETPVYNLDKDAFWRFLGGKKVTFGWGANGKGAGSGIVGPQTLALPSHDPVPPSEVVTAPPDTDDPPDTTPFVLAGGVMFPLPSPEQLAAIGLAPEPTATGGALFGFVPRDGIVFQEQPSGRMHIFFRGARFSVSFNEMNLLPFFRQPIVQIWDGALDDFPTVPRDSALVRERVNPNTFLMEDGLKRLILTPERFEQLCLFWENVRTVPAGGLANIPTGTDL